jgi:hypothetical protein
MEPSQQVGVWFFELASNKADIGGSAPRCMAPFDRT